MHRRRSGEVLKGRKDRLPRNWRKAKGLEKKTEPETYGDVPLPMERTEEED